MLLDLRGERGVGGRVKSKNEYEKYTHLNTFVWLELGGGGRLY